MSAKTATIKPNVLDFGLAGSKVTLTQQLIQYPQPRTCSSHSIQSTAIEGQNWDLVLTKPLPGIGCTLSPTGSASSRRSGNGSSNNKLSTGTYRLRYTTCPNNASTKAPIHVNSGLIHTTPEEKTLQKTLNFDKLQIASKDGNDTSPKHMKESSHLTLMSQLSEDSGISMVESGEPECGSKTSSDVSRLSPTITDDCSSVSDMSKRSKKRNKKRHKKPPPGRRSVSRLFKSAKLRKAATVTVQPGEPQRNPEPISIVGNFGVYCSPIKAQVLRRNNRGKKRSPRQNATASFYLKNLQTQPSVSTEKIQPSYRFPKVSDASSSLKSSVESVTHTPRTSFKAPEISEDFGRVTKVYLSERQSDFVKINGVDVPCAPPATPTPEQLRRYEYVPSMFDIRAQRAVKVRLEALAKIAVKKKEKEKERRIQQEKQTQKAREADLRHRQRLQIYALNKFMTELENKNFKDFMLKQGLTLKEVTT